MSKIAVVYLNGVRESDGLSSFSRPILYSAAADWVTAALCSEKFDEPTLICPINETPFASEREALDKMTIPHEAEHVLIMSAAMPELTEADFSRLADLHAAVGNDVTLLCCESTERESAAVLYGAQGLVRGIGRGTGTRALHAVIFKKSMLEAALPQARCLFTAVAAAIERGAMTDAVCIPPVTEIVDGTTAYEAQRKLMLKINMAHIANGVQIFAPESTYIAPDAEIGAGASILPGCMIYSGCKIGARAVIGPNSILDKATIGEGTSVNNSQVYESVVGGHATVGPFAYIRPGCTIGDNTRIGDFVELKKAQIGNGTKVSHLTYIGDAQVGERVNFGCGTVVVNYDGYIKSKTTIGDDCFIGCNTNLVAPVTLGDRVFTAAGTTVTKDVPDGALTVARARQSNLEGWNDRRRARMGKKD